MIRFGISHEFLLTISFVASDTVRLCFGSTVAFLLSLHSPSADSWFRAVEFVMLLLLMMVNVKVIGREYVLYECMSFI